MIFLSVRRLALGIAILLLLLVPVTSAVAHAELIRSDPAYGAVLPSPPAAVRLWFSERIDPAFSTATLVASNGAAVGTPQSASRAPDDQTQLVLPLSPLAPGTYTVIWRAVSADDGHKTNGTVVFTVGPGSSASQAPSVNGGAAPTTSSTTITPATSQTPSGGQSGAFPTNSGSPIAPTVTSTALVNSTTLPPQSNDGSEEPNILATVIRWLQLLSVALTIGGVFMGLVALRPLAGQDMAIGGLIGAWRRTLHVALLCLSVGVAGTLLLQVATVSDQGMGQVFQPAVLVPLLASRWGVLWTIRVWCVLLLVPLIVPVFWQLRARPLILALLVSVPLMLSFSLMSHAASMQSGMVLAVTTDWLHFAMASIWAGGLAVLLLLLFCMRRLNVGQRVPLTLWLVGVFSRVASIAVAVLIVTGVYSSLNQFSSLGELTSTSYGRLLLLKVALATVAFLLGAYHWLVARPQLSTVADRHRPARRLLDRLHGTVGIESVLAAVVLLVASGLVQTAPPAHMHMQMGMPMPVPAIAVTAVAAARTSTPFPAMMTPTSLPTPTPRSLPTLTPTPAPYNTSVLTGELEIGLTIDARAIGNRQFAVTVKNQQGPVAADRVRLQVRDLDRDLGTTLVELQTQSTGAYAARSPVFSLNGHWQVVVLVRRRGLEDVTATFPIDIP